MNSSTTLFTSQAEDSNIGKMAVLAQIKLTLPAVRSAQRDANVMWGLTRGRQLWLAEQEAEIKGIWKEHDTFTWGLTMKLQEAEDDYEQYSASALSDLGSAQTLYKDICGDFKRIWKRAINPGYPLRLDAASKEMFRGACANWHQHSADVANAIGMLAEEVDAAPMPPSTRQDEENVVAEVDWDNVPLSEQSEAQKHACLHWTGCYDHGCQIHVGEKMMGYFPKKRKPSEDETVKSHASAGFNASSEILLLGPEDQAFW